MNLRTEIKTVTLAGSGVMGASLAQIFAKCGYSVVLYDVQQEQLDKSKQLIAVNQQTLVSKGELSQEQSDAVQGRISFTLDKSCFTKSDFVLETIIENMDVKHKFFAEISELVGEDVVLATNTSGLSINGIAQAVKNPGRFAGMHWINPPHLIPLVEVIGGGQTQTQTLDIIRNLTESLGYMHVTVNNDPPGFLLNRLQFAVMREAIHIVESGYATPEDVDKVVKYALGLRYACVGPFETMDFGGVDTFYRISSYLLAELSDKKEAPELLRKLFEEGRFGLKSGQGIYDYSGNKAAEAIAKRDATLIAIGKCQPRG